MFGGSVFFNSEAVPGENLNLHECQLDGEQGVKFKVDFNIFPL